MPHDSKTPTVLPAAEALYSHIRRLCIAAWMFHSAFFLQSFGVFKSLIYKGLIFAFRFSILLKPAWNLGLRLSIEYCPQSYPQALWIVEKALMKRAVSAYSQKNGLAVAVQKLSDASSSTRSISRKKRQIVLSGRRGQAANVQLFCITFGQLIHKMLNRKFCAKQ